MSEEIKNIVEDDELLPTPESEAVETGVVDPDFIPAPEECDEYLPDITPEMIREEMLGLNEEGYSRCIIQVELKKFAKFNPETEENIGTEVDGSDDRYEDHISMDDEEDGSIPIANIAVENCKIREYSLDGDVVNLELVFDNPLDRDMQEVHRMLEEYKEMCDAFDKAEYGEGDYPVFSVYFMPIKYPMQGIATYSQPFAYFKTMGYGQDEERILHLMFPVERTGVTCYHVKKEEVEAVEEYVMSRINEGGNI